jgi:hypothetical protein
MSDLKDILAARRGLSAARALSGHDLETLAAAAGRFLSSMPITAGG